MKKVSIITPTSNIISQRTINSIERQIDENFEWIVVNDGLPVSPLSYFNKDGTVNHLHEKVKLVTLRENFGPSVARNIGFQVSDGDIITYLDSDDELIQTRVEELITTFSEYNIDLLFSAYDIVQDNKVTRLNHFYYFGKDKFFKDANHYIKILQKQNISIPMGVAHTRKPFVECGGFQRGIVCGEDGILWRRMVDKLSMDRIMFDDSLAGIYYVNEEGQSRKQPRFLMGGFAFDGSKEDNGKYLDKDWFKTYNSVELFDDKKE